MTFLVFPDIFQYYLKKCKNKWDCLMFEMQLTRSEITSVWFGLYLLQAHNHFFEFPDELYDNIDTKDDLYYYTCGTIIKI